MTEQTHDDPAAPPVASVVVPCHNSAATVGLQLEGLARQVGAPAFEVVLVDNRSADNLAAAAAPWSERLRLRIVPALDVANPGYARNVGVAHAAGEFLLFCDSDDFVGSGWVAEGCAALTEVPIVNGGALPVPAEEFERGPEHLEGVLRQEGATALDIPEEPEPYPILLGGSCGFRRDVYLAVGGYDAGTPYGVEDNDLALRAQAAGHVIARCSAMRLAYRSRPEAEQTLRRAFAAGNLHLLVAHRHGLFGKSPSLRPGWFLELPRCAGAAVIMAVRPGRRDWASLGLRTAMALGTLVGHLRYGLLRRQPQQRIGAGLDESSGAVGGAVPD